MAFKLFCVTNCFIIAYTNIANDGNGVEHARILLHALHNMHTNHGKMEKLSKVSHYKKKLLIFDV